MSARASRAKAKAEPVAAAAPAVAPAKARATRRKRGEDEADEPAAASAADAAPAPSEPKRARRGRGADSAEPARSPSPARSTAADEDEGSAMADSPRASPLDSLRVGAVGHMFCARDSASGRPPLPLILTQLTLDFLSATDIVSGAANTSRGGYATAVEYAKLVAHNAARATGSAADAAIGVPAPRLSVTERKKLKAAAAAASASSSSSSAAASAASFPASSMIGMRSEVTSFSSIRAITLLLSSRLRAIVSGIRTRSVVDDSDRRSQRTDDLFALEARLVGRIAETIPTLTSLACQLSSASVHPEFDFPSNLRSLHVSLMAKVAPHLSPLEKKARTTKPPKSWDEAQCDEYAIWVLSKAAALKKLGKLRMSTCASPHSRGWGANTTATPKPSWIQPLVACASLRELQCEVVSFRYQATLGQWAPAFRALTQLEVLRGWTVPPLKELLQEPHGFKALKSVPLQDVTISAEMLPLLQSLAGSLTDLSPLSWAITDLSCLASFSALRSVAFCPLLDYNQQPQQPVTGPSMEHIVDGIEALSLARRTQIESLRLLHIEGCSNELLERLLRTLPGLRKLALCSKTITSLSAFSSASSLASSLTCLHLKLPSVGRDEVTHLYSLLQLEELNIEGSFSEPLFAKQLFPFQPPYPKSPLHWLRSFKPRSANEPTPTPPVDLVARAAAYADFDARVRAGEVKAAELLNSAQLSGAFQFLSVADFSHAGRACRAWRAAASLPSAWGIASNKTDASTEDSDVLSGLWGSLFDWIPQAVHPDAHRYNPRAKFIRGRGRELGLKAQQPECRPGILDNLPLWRNARAIRLYADESHSYSGPPLPTEHREGPLNALALLPRVEQLSSKLSLFQCPALVVSTLARIGPHLRRILADKIPSAAYQSLTGLEELELTGVSNGASQSSFGPQLAPLHKLRKLSVLDQGSMGVELGLAVRALSVDHALREFNYSRSYQPMAKPVALFEALAGGHHGMATATASASSTGVVPMEEEKVCGLDDEESAPASAPTAPALLTRLRVSWQHPYVFPFRAVCSLPQLKLLEVCTPNSALDLSVLARMSNDGAAMAPLESLCLCGALDLSSLHHIELFPRLRELRLYLEREQSYHYPARPEVPDKEPLATPRWGLKLMHLRALEVLALDAIQIHPDDLAPLEQLPKLRALALARQKALQVSDLATLLPRLRGLTELDLACNPLLPLLQRDWMSAIGRPENSLADAEPEETDADGMTDAAPASAAAAAAAASSPSASGSKSVLAVTSATPGMAPVLLQCRSLHELHWQPSRALLVANQLYTTQRTYVKAHKSAALDHARAEKEAARDRQALRSIKEAHPQLRVCWIDAHHAPTELQLAPAAGSEAEEQAHELIAAREKEQAKLDKQRGNRGNRVIPLQGANPHVQACMDRDTLSMESKEEVYWKADADRMEAKRKGGNKKNKY